MIYYLLLLVQSLPLFYLGVFAPAYQKLTSGFGNWRILKSFAEMKCQKYPALFLINQLNVLKTCQMVWLWLMVWTSHVLVLLGVWDAVHIVVSSIDKELIFSLCSWTSLLETQLRPCAPGTFVNPVFHSISLSALSFSISEHRGMGKPPLSHRSQRGIIINHWAWCHNEH